MFIVFDNDNRDHLDTCRVLGFRVSKSIRAISALAEMVHSRARSWEQVNERNKFSFPYLGLACSKFASPSSPVSETHLLIVSSQS